MPLSKKEYFFYTIKDTTINTVKEFISGQSSFVSGFSASDFMAYDAGTGVRNIDRILNKYSVEDKVSFQSRFDYENFYIYFGTTILLPFNKVNRDVIPLLEDDVVISTDFSSFIANQLRKNYNDKLNERTISSKIKTFGSYKEMFSHISVWIWSRSLSTIYKNGEISYEDTIINVTPYISNLKTKMNINGGSFSFDLDAVIGRFNEKENKWEITSEVVKKFKNGEVYSNNYILDNQNKRSKLYFDKVLQQNDLVFIRFEKLKNEDDRINDLNTFFIDKKELQFKSFDMIGLIDQNQLSSNFSNNDVSIQISGRDLMKLFIEDGVYFYPFDYIEDGIFANETSDDRLQRYDGQLISKFQIGYKKIDNILKFIINALGTIKICSDTLFDSYRNLGYLNREEATPFTGDFETARDRRTFKYRLADSEFEKIKNTNAAIELNSRESIIQDIIVSRKTNGIEDPENETEVNSIYNDIFSFLSEAYTKNKLYKTGYWEGFFYQGQRLVREELPLSWNNRLFIVKSTDAEIFTEGRSLKLSTFEESEVVKNCIGRFFLLKERESYYPKEFETVPLKGVWQIIKIVFDKSVQDRIVADSSIGNEHGSLLNAIRKIAQEPLVEFFGDTYGDQYYLSVRKPPFDKEGFISLLSGNIYDENGDIVSSEPIVIDINDEDIEFDSLSYGGECFSWYKLNPQGNFAGGDTMSFAYLRAVYLKEYADIYGSKPLDIVSNYIPYQPLISKDSQPSEAYMIKQGCFDLKYLIESNAYLPFIRRGTITISGGDRRIKRGTLIRLVSTGEIGFVEAVEHSAIFTGTTIDRTTVVSIDRLMVEEYIKGVEHTIDGKLILMSYFNLVNTDIPNSVFRQNAAYIDFNKEVLSKWKTNVEVFNFFLQKKQFK